MKYSGLCHRDMGGTTSVIQRLRDERSVW